MKKNAFRGSGLRKVTGWKAIKLEGWKRKFSRQMNTDAHRYRRLCKN
jgi:hypothetical protein